MVRGEYYIMYYLMNVYIHKLCSHVQVGVKIFCCHYWHMHACTVCKMYGIVSRIFTIIVFVVFV